MSTDTNVTLQSAQDKASRSLGNFEQALEHLAQKVESTSERVEHVGDVVKKLKDDFSHLKSTAQHAVQPIMPLVRQGRDLSNRAIYRVQSQPRSLLWVAAGIFGLFWIARSMQSKRGFSASSSASA
jgi:chromosome segregation ATPase